MKGMLAWSLLFVFVILNVLDGHSTWLVVQPDHYRREKNPFARFIMKKLGLIPGIITLKLLLLIPLALVTMDYFKDDMKGYILVFSGADLLYSLVVSNNYRIYRKMRKRK
jgi:hypothetical protein